MKFDPVVGLVYVYINNHIRSKSDYDRRTTSKRQALSRRREKTKICLTKICFWKLLFSCQKIKFLWFKHAFVNSSGCFTSSWSTNKKTMNTRHLRRKKLGPHFYCWTTANRYLLMCCNLLLLVPRLQLMRGLSGAMTDRQYCLKKRR